MPHSLLNCNLCWLRELLAWALSNSHFSMDLHTEGRKYAPPHILYAHHSKCSVRQAAAVLVAFRA